MMTKSKFWLTGIGALALLAASCGSDDIETSTAATAATTESVATTTTEGVATTTTEAEPAEADLVEGVPDGMPNEYGGPILAVDSDNPPSPIGGGGFLVTLIGPVTADDGTIADVQFSVYDLRTEGGSVECGGEAREGAYTAENTKVSRGVVSITGWGKANVRIESTSHAFDAQLGAPFCDEQTGTWTGFEGQLDGRTGAFHRLMIDGQEAISLG